MIDSKRLTQAIARAHVRALGGTFKKTPGGDYRVRFALVVLANGYTEYFTDDLRDAMGTASMMAQEIAQMQASEGRGITPEVRRISCGCCNAPDGCVCLNHMDIPRGIRPNVCKVHSASGQVEYLRGGAA